MAERPGRRALFTGTTTHKRTMVPASVEEPVAERAVVKEPYPEDERIIGAITRALNQALSGAGSASLQSKDLDIRYTPVIDAVNAAIFRLTEVAPLSRDSEPGYDSRQFKEKEAEIEDLQQRIAMIIQQHPLPVLLVSPDLSIIEANSAFCQMSGLLRSQLIRHPVSVIVERERQGDGLTTAIRQRLPVEAEITVDLPAGTKILKQYAVPILDRSGGVEALQVIYTDQTPLKLEEKARKSQSDEVERQQQQYRNLVHGLPTPVMIIDGADAVLDVNPAFCEMSGYSREHLLTVRLSDYPNLTALTAGAVLSPDRRQISREISVEFPTGLHILTEDLILLAEQPGEGLPKGMIILCALEDISAQRVDKEQVSELSRTVQDQKRLIGALMRETPIPILLLDTSAVIVSANDAFVQLSGYSQENLSGMNISAFPLLLETGLPIEEAMLQNEGAFAEVKMEFVSGLHELERYCFPLHDDLGTLTNLLVFFNDQTHEKAQEKTIRALEEKAEFPSVTGEAPIDMVEMIKQDQLERTALLQESSTGVVQSLAMLGTSEFTPLPLQDLDPLYEVRMAVNTAAIRLTPVQSPVPAPALLMIDPVVLKEPEGEVPPEVPAPMVIDRDLMPDLGTVRPLQEHRVSADMEELRPLGQNRENKPASTTMVDVVAFEMAGQRYALDIQLAREIVEMIPITPIPRSPPYISGIINLRGEITNILNLYTLLGLPEQQVNQNQKIIVLVPDAAEGVNVGIIVDNVQSVTQVPVTDIEQIRDDASSDISGFVKGIIKAKSDDAVGKTTTDLIIWIDMLKVLSRLVNQ